MGGVCEWCVCEWCVWVVWAGMVWAGILGAASEATNLLCCRHNLAQQLPVHARMAVHMQCVCGAQADWVAGGGRRRRTMSNAQLRPPRGKYTHVSTPAMDLTATSNPARRNSCAPPTRMLLLVAAAAACAMVVVACCRAATLRGGWAVGYNNNTPRRLTAHGKQRLCV